MNSEDVFTRLLEHGGRQQGARELAALLGATHLCIFIRDPELKRLLPAPGFPQRLPKGAAWAKFLAQIEHDGSSVDRLHSPFSDDMSPVRGSILTEDACIVLFGEGAAFHPEEPLSISLRLFAALLRQEVYAHLAQIRAGLSSQMALESRQLAASLSEAHDLLSGALQAKENLLEEIRKKDERLRQVRHIAGIGTWEFNASTRQIEISPEVQEIYGIAQVDRIAMSDILGRIHPEDRRRVRAEVGAAYKLRSEHRLQFRVVWPNGMIRWVEDRGIVVYDADRKLHGLIGFSLDITQRVFTEEALIRSEKLSAAGRLAASIAHEINNPLEALVNLIYIARGAAETDAVREMLAKADAELIRVAAASRQALAFYREGSAATRFDVGAAVAQMVELFHRELQFAGVTPLLELPAQAIEALGWPGEIKQAITSLLKNAIHVSPWGSVLRIRVRARIADVRIVIADQGGGIRPEHLTRIFEPFYSTKKDSGSGLGLWVTQQIIAKHGGTIRVRSRRSAVEHGSVFVIRLPLEHEFLGNAEMHQRYRDLTTETDDLPSP